MGKKKKDKKKKSNKRFKGSLIESIQQVHFLYERRLDSTFADFDLSNEQFRILHILKSAPEGSYSLKQIRELLPNQTSNATRLVEKLKNKKLLSKRTSREDKRELRIALSPEGAEAIEAAEVKISTVNLGIKKIVDAKNGKIALKALENMASFLLNE